MNPLSIYAKIKFYEYDSRGNKIDRVYKTGQFFCFSIRPDTFSSGKIEFIDAEEVFPAQTIKATIMFFFGEHVSSYLKANTIYYIVQSFGFRIGEFTIAPCSA